MFTVAADFAGPTLRTGDDVQTEQSHLREGMRLIFNQESSLTTRSSRSSNRSSGSRSPSVSHRSWKRHSHGSRYSSSPSSSSRSHPRCCRALYHSRCRHRHQSRSYSPYHRRYGRRRYSRSISRSSSQERYYRKSRRSRSRSSSYRRARGAYAGKFTCRCSSSPMKRRSRSKSKSLERSIRLSQKDKIDLLNIARENAAKNLGVEVVKPPASVRYIEKQVKKTLESDAEKRVRADPAPLKKPPRNPRRSDWLFKRALNQKNPRIRKTSRRTERWMDEGEEDEDCEISRTSPAKKPISFSISNVVAKPSSSPALHGAESKVTSRADSVGNTKPYGKWIPVKRISTKRQ